MFKERTQNNRNRTARGVHKKQQYTLVLQKTSKKDYR